MIILQFQNSMTYRWNFMTFHDDRNFHEFPGLKNSFLKFNDLPGCVGTLPCLSHLCKHDKSEYNINNITIMKADVESFAGPHTEAKQKEAYRWYTGWLHYFHYVPVLQGFVLTEIKFVSFIYILIFFSHFKVTFVSYILLLRDSKNIRKIISLYFTAYKTTNNSSLRKSYIQSRSVIFFQVFLRVTSL